MFKKTTLFFLKIYQYYSRMRPASCRHYPSCSEYTRQQFIHNTPIRALWSSSKRILSCNQLFIGGIDYPLVYKKFNKNMKKIQQDAKVESVKYWFVPSGSENYYHLIQAYKRY